MTRGRNVRASKMIRARKIMANAVGNFTNDDFNRLMDEIANNIVDDYDHTGDIDDSIHDALNNEIDRACTYYADCFNIIWGSDTTEWSNADYKITSIVELACWIVETTFYDEYYDGVYERIEQLRGDYE